MGEDFWLEQLNKKKSDKELEAELLETILETKNVLENARCNFEYAEDELIDYYTYQIKAHQSKLDYLIKIAKIKGIQISRAQDLKSRLYNKLNKNNIAG